MRPGVVPYYDISFQHASEPLLRRMRRFGGREAFLDLVAGAREAAAGRHPLQRHRRLPRRDRGRPRRARDFLETARLDAVGVFGYSDEDGTEAEPLDDKMPDDVLTRAALRLTALIDELITQRAEDRVGEWSRCSWRA